MSIQDSREKIAQHSGALAKADPVFSQKIENRYQALKAKAENPHPADLRRLQGDISAWVENYLNAPNYDRSAYDGAMAWSALCQDEIDLQVFAAATIGNRSLGDSHPGGWKNAETGAEVRVVASGEKLSSGRHNGATVGTILNGLLFGAKTETVRAALSEGTDSAGGYSVPVEILKEFFDKLRARSTFIEAGARTMLLDTMKTRVVRIASDPTPAWRAENAAVTESAPTFEAVDFNAKSLAVLVKASWEVLADSVNIEDALEASLLGALAVELDRACLFGAGTATEPKGLFSTTGIGEVSLGANGAQMANYDAFVDGAYECELANAAFPTSAIMHPRTQRTLRKLKDTSNQPLMIPEALRPVKMLSSTSVPINQAQGTEAAASSILIGDFSQAILGLREGLTIQRLDQAYAGNGQVGFIARLRADVGFAQPGAFCRIVGIKP